MIKELDTRYGPMFIPDTDQGQYWWLSNTGASPEDQFIESVCELLDERPKAFAVDVGANFGCWTLPLAKHAHRVISIEPQIAVYELLSKSLEAGKVKNVTLMNVAAGAAHGSIGIPILDIDRDANFGGVSLLEPTDKQDIVDVYRLDDILGGAPVSFIKIDVEGFEDQVLTGARETIKRCKPILFVEMDHKLSNRDQLKGVIESIGYFTEVWGGNYLGMPYD